MNRTSLTINQINYWFTNARRRILPKWTLQRILEEQARANGEDPSTVRVKGSAQEARAVTKELLKGNTLESFLKQTKQIVDNYDVGSPQPKGHVTRMSTSSQGQGYSYVGQVDGQGYQYAGQGHQADTVLSPIDCGILVDYSGQDSTLMHNISNSTVNTDTLGLFPS